MTLLDVTKDGWEAVSYWFELSYAHYFVMPRVVLESMPNDWQIRFVALVDELNDTLDWGALLPDPGEDRYAVQLRDSKGRFIRDPLAEYRHPRFTIPVKGRHR